MCKTKRLYIMQPPPSRVYDEPSFVAERFDNFDTSPDIVAEHIIEQCVRRQSITVDDGRSRYWDTFYSTQRITTQATSFTRRVLEDIQPHQRLLELGCGNGRDARFFAENGHRVTAIDRCREAIILCRKSIVVPGLSFVAGTLPQVGGETQCLFDIIYSRFVIHAMSLEEEVAFLKSAFHLLRAGGRLFVECRSIHDPLSRLGEAISPTERIHGHYRRFIVLHEFRERVVAAGFRVTFEQEACNLAVYGNDNPVVVRLFAERPGKGTQ